MNSADLLTDRSQMLRHRPLITGQAKRPTNGPRLSSAVGKGRKIAPARQGGETCIRRQTSADDRISKCRSVRIGHHDAARRSTCQVHQVFSQYGQSLGSRNASPALPGPTVRSVSIWTAVQFQFFFGSALRLFAFFHCRLSNYFWSPKMEGLY